MYFCIFVIIGALCEPIIKEAGRSVSHWFNEKNFDLKTFVCPVRNITMPYTPDGRFLHCPPEDPSNWGTNYDLPWWKDEQYMIGKVCNSALSDKVHLPSIFFSVQKFHI